MAVVVPIVCTLQPDVNPWQEIPTECLVTKEQIAVDI